MPTVLVFSAYASSVALALLILYVFRARAFYWHVLALALSFAAGIMPPMGSGPIYDMIIGSVFLFLLFWGFGGAFFRKKTEHLHGRSASAD